TAEGVVGTGIIERKAIDLENDNPFVQQYQVRSQFSNYINRMRSRTSLRRLSYHLLLHDLEALKAGQTPFSNYNEDDWTYSEQEATELIALLRDSENYLRAKREQEPRMRKAADAFGYNYETLSERLNVMRDGDTDYLKIKFSSPNAEYSKFAVNTLAEDFIQMFQEDRIAEENGTVRFYDDLVRAKKARLDSLSAAITTYKQDNEIIDIEEQYSSLIGEIRDLEFARDEEKKTIQGLRKGIRNLDQYLGDNQISFSRKDANSLLLREDVAKLKDEKSELQERYNLEGRIFEETKEELDEKDAELETQLKKLAEERLQKLNKSAEDADLKDLMFKRIDAELDLLVAEESVASLNQAINRVKQRGKGSVASGQALEELEGEKLIVTEEYLSNVAKRDDATRKALASGTPLQIIEYAELPEKPESSKASIIAVLAGVIAAGAVGLLLLFLSLMDNRLNTPERFSTLTQLPVIGTLKALKNKDKNVNRIFEKPTQKDGEQDFREDIRRIRYAIQSSGSSKFLFTSPKTQEGKSFLIVALAHSFSLMKKKVLVVDTNLKNNTLTSLANKVMADNPLFNGLASKRADTAVAAKALDAKWKLNQNVDVLGNQGGGYSPAELLAGRNFDGILDGATEEYDYIFMEGPSMNKYSDTQELSGYADKIIAIFDAEGALTAEDKESIAFLREQEEKFLGAILNNAS
ncbi:MAG: hypothetical protein AAF738_04595, partial [Bacteroidota bacterium]